MINTIKRTFFCKNLQRFASLPRLPVGISLFPCTVFVRVLLFLCMLQYPFGTRQHQSSTRPNQSRYDIFLPCACCVYWETISSFGPYPTVSCNLLSYCFYLPLLHSFPSRFCALGQRELVLFVLFVGKTCERLRNRPGY